MSMLRMAVVGFPSHFSFNLNNRSSSTEVNLELPYTAQVYSSSSLKRSSPIPQAFPRRASGLVNLGSFSKVLFERICPLPLKALVVSHPQNACKARSAARYSGVYASPTSVILISLLCFPEPVSKRTVIPASLSIYCNRMKKMSLSGVLTWTIL